MSLDEFDCDVLVLGIGNLLWAGVGDTIRVSLSAEPEEEALIQSVKTSTWKRLYGRGFTLLKPEATRDDILRLCAEARKYSFASVCVNPYWAPVAAAQLQGPPSVPRSIIWGDAADKS